MDGKKHARNVYARTREACEEKLKVLIIEMKTELLVLKRQKAGGYASIAGTGGKEGAKENEEVEKEQIKRITAKGTE